MDSFVRFDNKVCFITGAGSASGIGFAAAKFIGALGGKIAIGSTTERIRERTKELQALGINAKE